MENLQKVIEELNMKLSNEMGHTAYWKGLAGTYRNENHKHIKQLEKKKVIIRVLVVLLILSYIAFGVVLWH